jgi:hypothetical protein
MQEQQLSSLIKLIPIKFAVKIRCSIQLFAWALFLGLTLASGASADSIVTPVLSAFDLNNTSADGMVAIEPDGLSFVLTGGNNGSGLPGSTDFTVTASTPGIVQFQYFYASLDMPGFDSAGYLVDDLRTTLADTDGISGNASFSVNTGQLYGWWVETQDNTGEPGILTVAFSPTLAPVPEPANIALAIIGLMFVATVQRIHTRSLQEEKI